MKKWYPSVFFLLFLFACSENKQNVVLKGRIVNDDALPLTYSLNLNGFCNHQFQHNIVPDSLGSFVVSLAIDSPCFTELRCQSNWKQVLLEPGAVVELEVGGKSNPIKIVGENLSKAQQFYDNLSNMHPSDVRFFKNASSDAQSICDSLDDAFAEECRAMDLLACSKEVRKLLKADRAVYYHLAVAALAGRKNVLAKRNHETTPEEVMAIWRDAVADPFLLDAENRKATYYYSLVDMSLWYRFYASPKYDSLRVVQKERRVQKQRYGFTVALTEMFLPEELQEYYLASYLLLRSGQKRFEKELIALASNFKSGYPNSVYSKYLDPNIDEIVDYQGTIARGFDKETEFVPNYNQLNGLEQCLKPFRGKKVYVDIWSTSCGYCKKQFAYNEALKQLLEAKGVETLYLSLDGDRQDERWKGMIKYYALKGNHVRANRALASDLRKKFGRFGIPRYLLIDEKGNVLTNDAPRPENLQSLAKLL